MSDNVSAAPLNVLSPANVVAFLERYHRFYDGLLRDMRLRLGRPQDPRYGSEPHGVILECSVIDNATQSGDQWVNIVLDVEAVSEMRITLGNQTWIVLSEGLSIEFFEGSVYLSINNEVETREEFATSHFLIIGKRCTWTARPYRE